MYRRDKADVLLARPVVTYDQLAEIVRGLNSNDLLIARLATERLEKLEADMLMAGFMFTNLVNRGCTNHAPVVATNECKYCAWARSKTNAVEK